MVVDDQSGLGCALQRVVRHFRAGCRRVLALRDQPCRIRLGLRAGLGSAGVAVDPLRTYAAGPVLPAQFVAGASSDGVGGGTRHLRHGAGLAQRMARCGVAYGGLA